MVGCGGGLVGDGDVVVDVGISVAGGAIVGTSVLVDGPTGVDSGNDAGVNKLQARAVKINTTINTIRLSINSPSKV